MWNKRLVCFQLEAVAGRWRILFTRLLSQAHPHFHSCSEALNLVCVHEEGWCMRLLPPVFGPRLVVTTASISSFVLQASTPDLAFYSLRIEPGTRTSWESRLAVLGPISDSVFLFLEMCAVCMARVPNRLAI